MSVIKGLTLAGAEGFDYSRFIAGVGSGIEQEGYNAGYVTPDVGLPSFALIFKDLGAGVVDVKPLVGAVAATFTRATTATTVLPTGLIGSVASGSPRSYYDPTSLAYLGYLAEGARTNLALQSEDFTSASWTKAGSTITSNTVVAPDGATTADVIVENGLNTEHYVEQAVTFATATAYTFSALVKQNTGTRNIDLLFFTNTAADTVRVIINPSTGAVVSGPTVGGAMVSASVSVQNYQNSYFRIKLTATTGATAGVGGIRYELASGTTYSYLGDSASGVTVWGAVLEAGAFASSYIPTTVATVTRNADVLTYPLSVISNTVGTMFAVWQGYGTLSGDLGSARIIGSGGSQAPITTKGFGVGMGAYDGVAEVATANTFAATLQHKGASFWTGATYGVCLAGGTVATGAYSGTIALTNLSIGTGGGEPVFGPISRVAFFPIRLPDAHLKQLTS